MSASNLVLSALATVSAAPSGSLPRVAWDGLLAGAAFGQVMLARLDFYFLVLIPLACLVFWRLKRQLCWRRLAFLARGIRPARLSA